MCDFFRSPYLTSPYLTSENTNTEYTPQFQNPKKNPHRRTELIRAYGSINGKYVVQGEINVNGIYGKIALTLSDNWHILEVLHQTSLQKLHSTREIDA